MNGLLFRVSASSLSRFSTRPVLGIFSYTGYFQLIQLIPFALSSLSPPPAPFHIEPFPLFIPSFASRRVARCRFISSSFFLNFFSPPFTISLSASPSVFPTRPPSRANPPACRKPVSSLPCSHSFTRPLFFFFRVLYRTISFTYAVQFPVHIRLARIFHISFKLPSLSPLCKTLKNKKTSRKLDQVPFSRVFPVVSTFPP